FIPKRASIDPKQTLFYNNSMKMKSLATLPYKLIAILLVGTAIIMGGVFAVGIPANIVYLFQ
ncbi:MAG: hypothetical protein LW878_13700, partial [Proteobacteria bacterium]|nr:hypothetical protein [Pseudomonadota bacterium]